MNTHPPFVLVRLLVPLPVLVDGGISQWRIEVAYYGKGGSKAQLIARCVSDPERPTIVFSSGRESAVIREAQTGILAKRGSLGSRLLSRLVRDGRAETVR